MTRYRICMNGNGKFVVQRRFGFLWYSWCNQYPHPKWSNTFGRSWGTRYDDSDAAIKALIDAQGRDKRMASDGQWTTVVNE